MEIEWPLDLAAGRAALARLASLTDEEWLAVVLRAEGASYEQMDRVLGGRHGQECLRRAGAKLCGRPGRRHFLDYSFPDFRRRVESLLHPARQAHAGLDEQQLQVLT